MTLVVLSGYRHNGKPVVGSASFAVYRMVRQHNRKPKTKTLREKGKKRGKRPKE